MEEVFVNNKKYIIIKLLGHGKGGYSYLAKDGDNYVVIKKIHHEPCSYYNFGNKIESEKNDYYRLIPFIMILFGLILVIKSLKKTTRIE